jgi:hypothetical protein
MYVLKPITHIKDVQGLQQNLFIFPYLGENFGLPGSGS